MIIDSEQPFNFSGFQKHYHNGSDSPKIESWEPAIGKIYAADNQVIGNNQEWSVNFGKAVITQDVVFDNARHRLLIEKAGVYAISAQVVYKESVEARWYKLAIYKNKNIADTEKELSFSQKQMSFTSKELAVPISVSAVAILDVGDVVYLKTNHQNGADTELVAGESKTFLNIIQLRKLYAA